MIRPSLVILTWNRKPSVEKSLNANIASAGYPLHEIVHVDNGSEPGFCEWFKNTFKPSVQVIHDKNLGVAVGYNRGLLLATGTHQVITGCDRIMPKNWLKTWVECFQKIRHTGVISCYTGPHPERMRAGPQHINGIWVQQALATEARMHSRKFLFDTGYWREDFGTYGYEDSEWANRAARVAKEQDLINYIVSGMGEAVQLRDDDFPHKIDGKSYRDFKNEIHADPRRKALFNKCNQLGSPYYNPYSRTEPDLL